MLLGCKQCSACCCLVFSEVLMCAFEGFWAYLELEIGRSWQCGLTSPICSSEYFQAEL